MPSLAELGGWPAVLGPLLAGQSLSPVQARAAFTDILSGEATPAQIAAFAVGLRMKGETVEEIAALLDTMVEFADEVPVDAAMHDHLVDTCGTGGDRSGTINVSTIAAFVVAGAGVPVCKHGNRAASSQAGSADVLEALGVAIDLGPAGVAHCLRQAGIGFCFAPRFHPAMRHAGPVRRELGVPTVFNFLGPLANPARVRRQVVGVSDPGMAERVTGVLQARGAVRALVVYGHDGLDELTTTDTSTVMDLSPEGIRTYVVDPILLGLDTATREQLAGGDPATNAALARAVLDGAPGSHRDLVLLNAAAGLVAAGRSEDLEAGLAEAARSIDDGAAGAALASLIKVSREAVEG